MRRIRVAILTAILIAMAAAGWYLHDPPWIAGITSGLRSWEEDPPGTRFRWTAGHATFYIPSDVVELTLPLRGAFPSPNGGAVLVRMSVDDRWLADFELHDPAAWVRQTMPIPDRPTSRRYRRVELRISRTVGQYNLGVQVGELEFRRTQ